MAWLECKGKVFRIRFRYGGAKHLLSLRTTDPRETSEALSQFEANLRLIERGVLAPPPETVDVGTYIVSGGKLGLLPSQQPRPVRYTLSMLFESYLKSFPKDAKEATTWKTEVIHIKHLERVLDCNMALADVTTRTLQEYINARILEPGKRNRRLSRDTVLKELGTFSVIWNKWAIPQGFVASSLPLKNLVYPKGRTKPPFQIREQIERQISSQKLTKEAQAELWQSLFLTLPEVDEFLNFIQGAGRPAYVYPMFIFAAHTGARRSEIRRSQISDFDFEAKTVLIREKKKDRSKVETYRTVPLSPRLESAMKTWLAVHPGGSTTICTPSRRAITSHYATKIHLAAVENSKWSVLPGWHCLRHSFISNCAATGVDQRLLDHWVGHTTEEMRRRYSHLLPAVSQAALLSVFGKVT
jgi:integrase